MPEITKPEPYLIPAKLAATIVGVCVRTIHNWTRYGLPSYRIGKRQKRFKRVEVLAFVERNRINKVSPKP